MANIHSGKAPTVTLSDKTEIPILGLGTWLNGTSSDRMQAAVEAAIEFGYRHIDTAAIYGTEEHIGRAIQNKIKDGTVKREELYVTTKLWNTNHATEEVIPALKQSLKNLQMDYVNMYLIHWPISFEETASDNVDEGVFTDIDYVDTWKAMVEAQKLGLAKSIGVSNFNQSQLTRLMASSSVKPVCNQIEVNPNLTQKKLIGFCKEQGIKVVAYTPLGSMTETRSGEKGAPAPHMDDPVLKRMADKYNKSTVQIVLRYHIDSGVIPIPKSNTPARIKTNIDVFDFQLTQEEIKSIDKFNLDYRCVPVPIWKEHKYYPFHE